MVSDVAGGAASSLLAAAVPRARGWTAQECSTVFGYEFVGDPDAIVSEKVVRFMEENPVMEQRTPEWFAARRKVITASDMAAAIGENIHKSKIDVEKFMKVYLLPIHFKISEIKYRSYVEILKKCL